MSTTIDERVVEMRFDNSKFESNVKTSMSTLDKLKQSLNLNGASKGLENINAEASKFGSTGLGSAVQAVGLKFSALQVAGVTALANITSSAVTAATRIAGALASAVTIDPIKDGFAEYETQMNAVQTILANTQKEGTNVKIVNAALDELNHYADKTIYNFTEMTRNIGTFTAAGVELDTSVSSIKGIANLAAVSGSTSQQASTAMYQLSQAIASGTVKLMDWNSVVNAGMGGQVFQDALIRTSEHLQTGAKSAISAEGSFRESLKTGWLTTEVLTQTLDQFATAADTQEEYEAAVKKFVDQGYTEEEAKQMADMARTAGEAATKVKTFTQLIDTLKEALGSGWTESWRIIIGDFEEARELWTKVSDYFSEAINNASDARNEMLKSWAAGGGREMGIEAIKNVFEGLLSVIKPIKEAFREVFPAMTAERLLKITKAVRDFTAKLKLSDEQSAKLKATFKGLFSVVDMGITFITKLVGGIGKLLGNFKGLGTKILNVTGSFGDWLSNLRDTVKTTDVFGKAIDGMVSFIQNGIDKVKEFISTIKENFTTSGFDGFIGLLKYIWNIGQKVGKILSDLATRIGDALANAFNPNNLNSGMDLVNGGLFATLIIGIKKFVGSLSDGVETVTSVGGILDKITGILDGVKGCLQSWQNDLKAGTLQKIAIAIGILAASLLVLSLIDSKKLVSSLTAITILFGEMMGALSIFNKINGEFAGAAQAMTFMIGISVAVLILASALKKVSSLNIEELGIGILGITALMAELVAAAKIMASDGTTVVKGAGQMLVMAVALKVLVWAFTDIAELNWEQLAVGVTGITALMAELVAAVKIMESDGTKVVKGAGQMIIISGALAALAGSLKIIASMSWEELATGLTGLTVSLGLLVGAVKLMTTDGSAVVKGAGQMVLMAGALAALAGVMKLISTMSWEEVAKGLVAIGSSMAILAIGLNSLKGTSGGAGSLLVAAAALAILAVSIKSIGDMNWEDIAKGLITIGGAMAILVIGLNAMSGTLQGSAALLVAAAALTVLGVALKIIGSTSIESIVKSLVVIAGIFVIVGVAGSALMEAVPAMLAFAAAIAAVGIACALIGVGISLAATGLTLLITTIIGGATALVSALTIIVSGIASLIPVIVQRIGEALILLLQVIADAAPAIGEAVKALVLMIVDVLVECVPAIAEGTMKLIVGVLNALAQYTPQIIESLFNFLIGIFDGLAEYLPQLTQSFVDMLMSFFQGVADALSNVDADLLLKGIAGVGLLSILMGALASAAILAPAAMLGVLAMGEVIAELALVLAAIGTLAQIPGLTWLINEGGGLLQSIGTAIGKFVGGIVGGIAAGVADQLPGIATNLSQFMTNIQPFINGMKSIDPSLLEGAILLASTISCVTASSVISGIASFLMGDSSMATFGSELAEFGKALKTFSDNVAGVDPAAMTAAANAGKAIAEMASIIPNEGGLVAWFTGDNSLAKFGPQMAQFGASLRTFSDNVAGIDSTAIVSAASAGKAIAEMASIIPNEGGLVAWFTGDNSLAKFGPQIATFGYCLKAFSNNVTGIDLASITAATIAGRALAQMADTIPNEGGLVAWFTGENSIVSFATQIVSFGYCLRAFANLVTGINPEEVIAAANAAKALAEMANTIPNEGGIVAWFAGENSMAAFATQIVSFGYCLKAFANNVAGIDPAEVTAAANAAKALAQMADTVPNEGGLVAWFAGENSLAKFGPEIGQFGANLRVFAANVDGITPDSVTAAANAGKILAEMTNTIPNEGGIKAWFAGENSLSKFGTDIADFGSNLKAFSDNVTGITPEEITAAANAGKALAEMVSIIPNEGGIKAWFSGENGIAKFGPQMADFGSNLKAFSDNVTGIVPENITAAANAGKTLAQMADTLPKNLNNISTFGSKLETLADKLKAFSSSMDGVDVSDAVSQVKKLVSLAKDISGIDSTTLSTFAKSLKDIGSNGVKKFISAFDDAHNKAKDAIKSFIEAATDSIDDKKQKFHDSGKKLMEKLVDGIKSKKSSVKNACKDMVSDAADALDDKYDDFYDAGGYLVEGFADGIDDNAYQAKTAAKAMANAAKKAAEEALGINSPSKVFYGIGGYTGQGFVNALDDYGSKSYDAASEMANSARRGMSDAISKVNDYLNSDMDTQPTIRPVLDLSDVKSGANSINGWFNGNRSISILSDVGTVSSMMNQRNQNGVNDDVVSAINKLRKDLGNVGNNSYVVNGVTYDDGSNVSDAVQALVRAARIERRI